MRVAKQFEKFRLKSLSQAASAWLLGVCALAGCKVGGGVTSAAAPSVPSAAISAPIIVSPALATYYSNSSTLLITGICQSGSNVILSGSVTAEQPCIASSFQFTVNKPEDGIFTFFVSQGSSAQNSSNPAALVWVHKSSVAQPIVTSPAVSPFSSGRPTLTITGACETGATISLSGDAAGSVSCANSAFSIDVPKAADGDYTIAITQTDPAGNTASTSIVWKKKALTVTPNNPYLVVKTPQVLTISGGSGVYTATITVNNSGATYDAGTGTFTPGTLANVVDTLVITDSLGNSGTIYVTTVAGAPDHFSLPATGSGSGQTALVGHAFADPLKVKIVDRYENGIAAQPVLFSMVAGDASFTSQPLVVSDANGLIQVGLRAGLSSVTNTVSVAPLAGTLPDVAGTGHASIQITETTSNLGTGKIGSVFAVAQNPGALIVRDFNGDTYPDVAILNVGDASAGILLGQSNGLLGTMTKIKPLCGGPNSITAGDINGDSHLDLVIACSGSNKIVILIGNGAGAFAHATGSPFSTNANETIPTSAAIGDFDHDGKADIAVGAAGGAVVGIWRGNGQGQFTTPQPSDEHTIGQTPSAVVAVDLDKNGWLDLLVTNSADDTFSVLMNTSGTFAPHIPVGTGSTPSAITTGDFDGDTYPDVAVVENGASQISVFLNDHAGGMALTSTTAVGTSPTWMAVGDYNGDSKLDISVVNSGDNTAYVLAGAGNGNFTVGNAIPTVTNPLFLDSADMNKDGYLDLVVSGNTDQNVQVIAGRGNGTFGLETPTDANPFAAASADFDGDGLPDLAVVHKGAGTLGILKGKDNGFFTTLTPLTTGVSPVAVRAADLDTDGKLDLIVANGGAGSIRVFKGNGDGTFATGVNYGVGSGPADLTVTDLNRDGKFDLVACNTTSSNVSVLIGIGDGTFYSKVDYQTGTGPVALVAADLNGDQRMDIVVASQVANTLGVLLGNGDGTLQAEIAYQSGLGPFALVAGDVNNDGIVDLISANAVDNAVSVLTGAGDGSLHAKNDYSAGSSINSLLMGDFNGDSRPDLLVSNGVSNSLTLLPGASNGQYNSQTTFTTSLSPTGLALTDQNTDGKLDIVLFDGANNLFQIWLGH